MKNNDYSKYIKCDLHIHTNLSSTTKENDYQGDFKLDKLINTISSPENNIRMFSLTDHNIINYSVYQEYYEKYSSNERILFVGVELDIIPKEYLLEKIHASINKEKNDKEKYHSIIIFKNTDAKKLNDKLDEMYKEITDEYNEKYKTKIDLNKREIKSRFTTFEKFATVFIEENYLVISHGNKKANIKDAYKSYQNGLNEAQTMILIGIVDALEMSPGNNAKTIECFNEGFQSLLTKDYSANKEVPYVVFSDNHDIDCYPKHDKNQKIDKKMYTWIKGNTSFESLRMAFVDPTSRIYVSDTEPKSPEKYIESLKFDTLNSNAKKNHVIQFSPGINTIVGGRSSGKSLLFNALLESLKEGKKITKVKNYTGENNKVLDEKSIMSKLNCETEYDNMNVCDIKAYTQEEIIEMFNNNGKGLQEHLDFKRLDEESLNKKISEYSLIIDRFVNGYDELYKIYNNKMSRITINTIIDSSKELDELYVVDSIIEKINKTKNNNISQIRSIIDILASSIVNVDKVLNLQNDYNIKFNTDELKIIEKYKELLLNKKNEQLKKYKNEFLLDKYTKYLSESLGSISDRHRDNEAQKAKKAKITITNEKNRIFDYFYKKLAFKRKSQVLESHIIEIEERNNKISDNYTLNTRVERNIDYNFLKEEFIEKFSKYNPNTSLYDNFINMLEGNVKISRKDNTTSSVEAMFSNIKKMIYENLKPKYTIIEKNKGVSVNSDNMSQGKKASVYLEIMLEQCKNSNDIILIDQPEDNIDNEFIADVLVDKIRDLRMNNQVILVTHNAAIAINSDSENIIIASNDAGNFKYETGGLENVSHRERICKMLDGGDYIFDNRYHKYNIINRKINEPLRKGEEV